MVLMSHVHVFLIENIRERTLQITFAEPFSSTCKIVLQKLRAGAQKELKENRIVQVLIMKIYHRLERFHKIIESSEPILPLFGSFGNL